MGGEVQRPLEGLLRGRGQALLPLLVERIALGGDHPCLRAWADSLGGVSYPLLSDFWPHGGVAQSFGVMRSSDGKSERAIFILDAQGVVRYVDVHDIDHQPSNDVLFAELRRMGEDGDFDEVKEADANPAEKAALN